MTEKPDRVPSSTRTGCLAAVIVAGILLAAAYWQRPKQTTSAPSSAEPTSITAVSPDAKDIELFNKEKEARAKQDQLTLDAANLALQLRRSARNPDSFVLERVLIMPSGAICTEYRAQNGFGGMSREQALLIGQQFLTVTADDFELKWNIHCGGRTGSDITKKVLAIIVANAK
jgi:hypothetical protein